MLLRGGGTPPSWERDSSYTGEIMKTDTYGQILFFRKNFTLDFMLVSYRPKSAFNHVKQSIISYRPIYDPSGINLHDVDLFQ